MNKFIAAAVVVVSIGVGVMMEKNAAKKQRRREVQKLQKRVEKVETFLSSVKDETEGSRNCRADLVNAITYMKDYINDVAAGAFFYSVALGHLESAEDYFEEVNVTAFTTDK